jgi:hypothetical protein
MNNPGVHLRPHLGPTDNSNLLHMRLLIYLSFVAPKPMSEVTQEEIEQTSHNANILDFVNSLSKLVVFLSFFRVIGWCHCSICSSFNTEVGSKALSCQVVRNVCAPTVTVKSCWHCHVSECIAIACALLCNLKVLLLGEVCKSSVFASLSIYLLPLSYFCAQLTPRENLARCTGPGSQGSHNDCHCPLIVNHPERGLHVSCTPCHTFTTTKDVICLDTSSKTAQYVNLACMTSYYKREATISNMCSYGC